MVGLVGVLVREGWNLVDDVQVLSGDSLWQSQKKINGDGAFAWSPFILFNCRLPYQLVRGLGRRVLKQSLQYTGRSPRGLKGTVVSLPQSAQTAGCISRGPCPNPPPRSALRACLQAGHRLGSFVNPFSAWKA